jgi:RluA family pseudouridine synthase
LDDNILVVDKPAGLSVLPEGWDHDAAFLVKILQEEFGKIFVVHRLDKLTSGVMVLARNPVAHRCLSIQFEKRLITKEYHALAFGVPVWREKIARHPLLVNVGHKHRTIVDPGHGKPSITQFKVLRGFEHHVLLEAIPLTGRTHQIRVHAYALGLPILGDPLYGSESTDLINRPALHAISLTFKQPKSNDWSEDLDYDQAWSSDTFTSPYPADFESALAAVTAV